MAIKKFIFQSRHGSIPIYVQDKHAKTTLFFVHGINAGGMSAKNLFNKDNNFNVISFDFPRKKATYQMYVDIVEDITNNFLVGENFAYLGHSLGAAICLSLQNRTRIKELFLISPLNPSLAKTINYTVMQKTININQKIQKLGQKVVSRNSKIFPKLKEKVEALEDITKEQEYQQIFTDHVFNRKFLEEDLDALFKKYPAHYAIGSLDQIIPAKAFIEYVLHELEQEIRVFKWARHSPFKDNPKDVNDYLNQHIKFEKRGWLTRFYSLKNVEQVSYDYEHEKTKPFNGQTTN